MVLSKISAVLSQLNCLENSSALTLYFLKSVGSFNKDNAACARLSGELSLTKIPVSACFTESLSPGTLYAMTGVPIALDSVTTNPQPSLTAGAKTRWALDSI